MRAVLPTLCNRAAPSRTPHVPNIAPASPRCTRPGTHLCVCCSGSPGQRGALLLLRRRQLGFQLGDTRAGGRRGRLGRAVLLRLRRRQLALQLRHTLLGRGRRGGGGGGALRLQRIQLAPQIGHLALIRGGGAHDGGLLLPRRVRQLGLCAGRGR